MRSWLCSAMTMTMTMTMTTVMMAAGCGVESKPCEYDGPTSGTVKIDSISDPIDINGNDCFTVKYEWVTNGPSKFPSFDQAFASQVCLINQNYAVGSTFEVSRQDETQGTCTPSLRTVVTANIAMCVAMCTAPTS